MWTRRDWMRAAGHAAIAAAVTRHAKPAGAAERRARAAPDAGPLFCLFSKPLPELDWDELGRVVKETGFDGVDLTV
jgi:hypothetical protein